MSRARTRFALPGAIAVALLGVLIAGPAAAASVEPVVVPGNPDCGVLGVSYAFKIDPPASGTFSLDGVNTITVTIGSNPQSVSFTSTIPIDKFIVKAGPNANVYSYDPEVTHDEGLVAPINPNNGQQYGFSHFEICFDYEVAVSKTATPTYTRTYAWTIDKSVSPAALAMFRGDSGTVTYDVALGRTVVDSDFAVAGQILVHNPAPFAATVTSVTDVLSDGTTATVDCGASFPITLAAGATLTCSYTAALTSATDLTNTATVATTGAVGGGTGTASVDFGEPTTVLGYPSVNVSDTNGSAQPFAGSGTWSYTKTFTCDGDEGSHGNTATIVETGQSDSASVLVACYALGVTKSARTEHDRTYTWSITKTASTDTVTLSPGQLVQVGYTVSVSAVPADSGWAANGTITVTNGAPIPATLNGVTDALPGGSASVECGVTFPYLLAAGSSLSCTWTSDLPDASARTNTATATLRNTPSGTTDFTGTATVDFSSATIDHVDECVSLSDTFPGAGLGDTCFANGATQTFTYNRWIGPYDVCGTYSVENEASFETNDGGATGSDDATIAVNVPCETGCTLTPGYWKTHSINGPAPYDDTWLQVGEETAFFLSGQSYYQALWTPPQGNAYYILAHAWIATRLNLFNGASVPAEVQDAFNEAEILFGQYTPAQVAALKGKTGTQLRGEILGYAWILDQYNNGLAAGGPPHCSE